MSSPWCVLRRRSVAWWLSKELLDLLVTRLAQSSLAKLRSETQKDFEAEERIAQRRQKVDEAVFWSVVLGSNVTKLRALLRAGEG